MDYLVIGSNGFAQVGTSDFYEKNRIEMSLLLAYLEKNYPIPEEFQGMCQYREKWFNHDFGSYSEIVLIYNDRQLDCWDKTEPEKFNRFWEWFNQVEEADLENVALSGEMEKRYEELKSMQKKSTHI